MRMLSLDLSQELSPFMVRPDVFRQGGAYLLRYLEFLGKGTVFDVCDIVVIELVSIVDEFENGRRIRGHEEGHTAGNRKPHHSVIPCSIVTYVVNFRRSDKLVTHETGDFPCCHSGNGAEDGAILGVTLYYFRNGNHKASAEPLRAKS